MLTDTAATAVAFIEAFGTSDMDTVGRLLADDVVFESPRVKLNGRQAVQAAMTEFAQSVESLDIVASFGDDNGGAVVIYDMQTTRFGTIRATDHLTIRNGKVQADSLLFDTHTLRGPGPADGPREAAIIRYATAPELVQENRRLVEDVFAELRQETPAGLSYSVVLLDDGVTFQHTVGYTGDDSPLTRLRAFQAFQEHIGDRIVESPHRQSATLIGAYTDAS